MELNKALAEPQTNMSEIKQKIQAKVLRSQSWEWAPNVGHSTVYGLNGENAPYIVRIIGLLARWLIEVQILAHWFI